MPPAPADGADPVRLPPGAVVGSGTTDYLLARGGLDDVAVVDGGRSYSYADIRAAVGELAAELAELDLPPGSHVGIVGRNSFFWVAAYLAAMREHVAVPFSVDLSPTDLARQARVAGCSAVLVDRRQVRSLAGALPDEMPIITDASLLSGRRHVWPEPEPVALDADAALMFTSGTTADPRAVRVTHRNIQANTDSIISCLGLRQDDRMLVVLPFSYCFGLSLLHTHLRVGGTLVLCNSFVFPETALDMVDRERCTGFAGVPSSFQLLLRASSFRSRPLPSLRMIQQAGGRLAPVLVDELLTAKPRAELFVMYGQTEATARLSYLPPGRLPEKPGSIGISIPGVELRVLDECGNPVPPGVTGEIVARGANISPGYYNEPEETARRFPSGELRTGDLAVVDSDGFLFVVDRVDDFIKSWGYRISSQEIEACALLVEDLVSAAAIGLPDLEAGEAITLVAVARPGSSVTADDVLAFTRSRLAKFKVPQSVHLVDSLPLTANGKIAKARLREMYRSVGLDGQVTRKG